MCVMCKATEKCAHDWAHCEARRGERCAACGHDSLAPSRPEPNAAALQLIESICRAVPPEQRRSARSFHDAVGFALVQRGWKVYREFPAPSYGFIDLVVTAPLRIAIELDRFAPRDKSMRKLSTFDGLKVVVLRHGDGGTWRDGDVVVIECGHPRQASPT